MLLTLSSVGISIDKIPPAVRAVTKAITNIDAHAFEHELYRNVSSDTHAVTATPKNRVAHLQDELQQTTALLEQMTQSMQAAESGSRHGKQTTDLKPWTELV